MENNNILTAKKKETQPLKVKQTIIGLELERSDQSILRYFDFFTNNIPTQSVHFIHVVPSIDIYNVFELEENINIHVEFDKEKVKEDLDNELKNFFSKKENMNLHCEMKEGHPLEELLDSAEDLKADLVVIGQKKGVAHHGITAKKFIRKAKGNALIIPEKSKPEMKSILVPVDFSENSGRALQTAMAIKLQMNEPVKIIALNLFNNPDMSSYKISRSRSKFQSMVIENMRDAFERFLERYIPEEKDEVETILQIKEKPKTADYIHSFAKKNGADFVVMGAKGHSRFELLLMGSVTEKFLNINDSIPTLIVK